MNIDDQGGYAAKGRVDIKLADLGTLYMSGSTQSVGFGSLDQSINERALSSTTQLDAASNLELGKLLPKRAGLSVPFMAAFHRRKHTEYDPYDLDIKFRIRSMRLNGSEKDSIREEAIDVTPSRV